MHISLRPSLARGHAARFNFRACASAASATLALATTLLGPMSPAFATTEVSRAPAREVGIRSLGPTGEGGCLDAWDGPVENRVIAAGVCWGNHNQRFAWRQVDGAAYGLIQIGPWCATAIAPNQNGSELNLRPCNPQEPAQHFWLASRQDYPEIGTTDAVLTNGRKCLDLKGNPFSVGVRERREVVLWDCNGQRNQRWEFRTP